MLDFANALSCRIPFNIASCPSDKILKPTTSDNPTKPRVYVSLPNVHWLKKGDKIKVIKTPNKDVNKITLFTNDIVLEKRALSPIELAAEMSRTELWFTPNPAPVTIILLTLLYIPIIPSPSAPNNTATVLFRIIFTMILKT